MDKKIDKVINLTEILQEKNNILVELLNLTEHQLQFLKNQEIDKLGRVLESKQLRIDRIDKLDKEFVKQFTVIKSSYGIQEISELEIDKKYLRELKNITMQITVMLEKLYKLDQQIQKLADKNHKSIKARIKKINTGRKARKGYKLNQSHKGSVFMDRKN